MKYELHIRAEIYATDDRGYRQSGGLTVEETGVVKATSFLEVAAILGKFHELTESFKDE